MSTASTLHIMPEGTAWAIKLDEAAAPSSVHPTQGEAIVGAIELLKAHSLGTLLIHGMDGRGEFLLTCHHVVFPDDAEDAALRAEALRITPSNDRLRAMIGKFPLPPGDYDDEEPCY